MSTTKRGVFGLILGAVLGLGAIGGAAASNSWITDEVDSSDTVVSGCVIRFSDADGRPSIHANGAHICAGVKSVGINQHGEIVVKQTITDPTQNPIVFAFMQPDETLSSRGIIGGASGGTGETRYRLHDTTIGRQLDLTQHSDRMRIQGETSNLWVGFVHAGGAR